MANPINLNFKNIKFLNGFWKSRYELNKNVSLKAVYDRFEETGRFDSLRFNCREGKTMPHIFYDSDVAKWIEAVGYLIEANGGGFEKEQEVIDKLSCDMAKNQLPDGYVNGYFIQIEPNNRFSDRSNHELYCAGHLIEGAIAYARATGKTILLNVMKKYVDCIERYFVKDKLAKFTTCGHEEIELALIKLYEYTNEKKYLDLALFFLNSRGVVEENAVKELYTKKYDQSEVAVRNLEFAEGHAVRAVYLYIAMAEAGIKTKDKALIDACKRVWRDIINKKMYITGGIGSGKNGEAFTVGYDLPNLEAYSESCAAIGLMLFALSMQKTEINAEFGAVIEKIMYNGLLSSTSIDGKSFFYENPLEIHLASVDKETSISPNKRNQLPIRHRVEIFYCSCCPPNINRIFARLGDFFFSSHNNSLVINQYGEISYDDGETSLKMITNYPNDGKVKININTIKQEKIMLRIPDWCEKFTINCAYEEKNGYIIISNKEKNIEIDFNMTAYFIQCNPHSRDNAGKVAVCYGPVVYCIEKIDNNFELNALSVDINSPITVQNIEDYGMRSLSVKASLDADFKTLYRKAKNDAKEVNVLLRPYWTFANREETDMIVWIRKK